MAFQLSPGVLVVEKDLTNIIPAVATSTGAFVGAFQWGPVLDPTLVSSENQLVARFGKPTDGNASSFFTAANFLTYTNNLQLIRVDTAGAKNAVATQTGFVDFVEINDGGADYETPVVTFSAPNIEGGVQATGIAVVEDGVITGITITEAGSGYSQAPSISVVDTAEESVGAGFDGTVLIEVGGIKINNEDDYMAQYVNGLGLVGSWAAKYPGALGNSIRIEVADADTFEGWDYAGEFDAAPETSTYVESVGGSNDELHVIVVDEGGLWTGVRGAILEKFSFLSKASDARKPDGTNNYYKDAININSKYVWWMDHPVTLVGVDNWGLTAENSAFKSLAAVDSSTLSGGADDLSPDIGDYQDAWSIFANAELYDISLLPVGQVPPTVAKYVIENVAETRKDCVAFVSPVTPEGAMIQGADIVEDTIDFRRNISFNVNSSYGVLDSGFKYMYDRYNDVYRWVPLNGDTAGLCARTDYTNDP